MARISWNSILSHSQRTILRFPLVVLNALICCILSCVMVMDHAQELRLMPWLMAAGLGIVTFLVADLLGQVRGRVWLFRGMALVLLGGYYLSLPHRPAASDGIRLLLLLAGMHALVAVVPFLGQNTGPALWSFNKNLLLRLVSAVLFSLVLFAGLAMAMAALEHLLGVNWHGEAYLQLFFMLGFVFNTWFFLGGVPEDLSGLATESDFPRPLRILAQHILSSLVVVYLAILMVYLAKVVLSGVWPSGWIGWLVSSVAVAGLLSVMLLAPLHQLQDSRWVGVYFFLFHLLMVPAAVMLALALGQRIGQYGWTEPRYILAALTVWLLVVLGRFLVTRRPGLRFVPLSLAVVALLISVGPWGAVAVSRHSQLGRLAETLRAHDLLRDGKLVVATHPYPADFKRDLEWDLTHIFDQYGPHCLDSWLTDAMVTSLGYDQPEKEQLPRTVWSLSSKLITELGIQSAQEGPAAGFVPHHRLTDGGRSRAASLEGFTHLLMLELRSGTPQHFNWGGRTATLQIQDDGRLMLFERHGQPAETIDLMGLLQPLLANPREQGSQQFHPAVAMTFDIELEGTAMRLLVHEVLFSRAHDEIGVQILVGVLLLP